MNLTHKQLVEIAYKWVLKNAGCGVAFKEINSATASGEIPDVIGFGAFNHSVLVEAKVSRSDFLADKKNKFRKDPTLGMGKHRFFIAPKGLIKISDLPENWGLIEVSSRGRAIRKHNPYGGNVNRYRSGFLERNLEAEHGLMYSALRRLHLRNVVDKVYEPLERT